jgi:release factor glutamine methyltransferase
MQLNEIISYITDQLIMANIDKDEAHMMARILIAHKIGVDLPELALHHLVNLSIDDLADELAHLKNGEPLQYILGETQFMGLDFFCTPSALIPRGDSEVVAEFAINLMKEYAAPKIADICTGCGTYALAIAKHLTHAQLWAVDVSLDALALAKTNSKNLGLEEQIKFLQGDLLFPLIEKKLLFDLVISNPPYIQTADLENLPAQVTHEPALALDGGADGLYFYRRLAADGEKILVDDGLLLVEHGADQTEAISQIMEEAGFIFQKSIMDYGHNHRGLLVKWPKKKAT